MQSIIVTEADPEERPKNECVRRDGSLRIAVAVPESWSYDCAECGEMQTRHDGEIGNEKPNACRDCGAVNFVSLT